MIPERADLVRGLATRLPVCRPRATVPTQHNPVPEQLLDTQNADGFAIRALYTAFDELPEPPAGPVALCARRRLRCATCIPAGRLLLRRFPPTVTADTNAAVLAALGEGPLIRVGTGVAPDRPRRCCPVYLNLSSTPAPTTARPGDVMLARRPTSRPALRRRRRPADLLLRSTRLEVVARNPRAAGERGLSRSPSTASTTRADPRHRTAATVKKLGTYLRVLTAPNPARGGAERR